MIFKMNEIIDFFKKNLEEKNIEKDYFPYFDNHELVSVDKLREITLDKDMKNDEIFFVDGGSSVLVERQNFVIEQVNVGFALFKGVNFEAYQIFKFIAFIKLIEVKRPWFKVKITYKALEGEKKSREKHGKFIDFDPSIQGITLKLDSNNEITKAGDMFRRLLELKLSSKLNPVVLDGSLDWKFDEEKEIIENLKIIALSKSTNLITSHTEGFDSFFYRLDKKTNKKAWIVKIGQTELFESYAVHFSSDLFFRMDTSLKSGFEDMLKLLLLHAKDGQVLGYPFGLFFIDTLARVSNEDARFYKTILEFKLRSSSLKNLHDDFNSAIDE